MLPKEAFCKNGEKEGPAIVMMHDSSAEHNTLHQVWSHAQLCCVHFISFNVNGLGYIANSANRIANQDGQVKPSS